MRQAALICCAVLVLSTLASGNTYVVDPFGTGDFPTVQDAVDAAKNGDSIELTDGTFSGDGNRNIDFLGKAITVASQSGDPSACIIECGGSEAEQHRGFHFHSDEGPDSVLEGITIQHGWVDAFGGTYGGGIYCEDQASPTITGCILYRNEAAYGGGMCGGADSEITACSFIENTAVRGGGLGRSPNAVLTNCRFAHNSGTYGGGIYIRSSCSPTITGCVFERNTASHSGGALHIEQHCNPVVTYCTFTANSSPIGGVVDVSIESSPTFRNCTLSGNSCGYTGTVSCYGYSFLTFENTIISFGTAGEAITCYDSEVALTCCDIFGNADGDWVGYIAGQLGVDGNIHEDPLFCLGENPEAPYTLHTGSPCAPGHDPACGLVGAWDVGCGVTPVDNTSWGAIKAQYR